MGTITLGMIVAVMIGAYCVCEFAVKPLEKRIKALEDRETVKDI